MYSVRNPVPKKSFKAKKEAKIRARQQQVPPAVIEPTVGIDVEAPQHPVVETSVKIIELPKKEEMRSKARRTLGQALREHQIPLEYVRRLNDSYADKILKGYGMETEGFDLNTKRKMVLERQSYLHKKGKLLQWHSFRLHYFPNRRIRLCQAFVPEAHKMIQEARPPPPSEAKRKTYTRYASPSFVEPPSSTESTRMVSMFTSPGSTPNKVPLFLEELPTSASKPATTATTATTATAAKPVEIHTVTMEEQEESEPSSFTVSDVDEQDAEIQQQFMVGEDPDLNEDDENDYFRTPDRVDQGGPYQEDSDDKLLEAPIVARLNTLESLIIDLGVKLENVVLELKNLNKISAGQVGVIHHKKRKQFQ